MTNITKGCCISAVCVDADDLGDDDDSALLSCQGEGCSVVLHPGMLICVSMLICVCRITVL